jgi:hypothetical protein
MLGAPGSCLFRLLNDGVLEDVTEKELVQGHGRKKID